MTSTPSPLSPLPPLIDRPGIRWLAAALLLVLLIAAFASMRFDKSLSHVDVAVLSGEPQGNYHAVVEGLAQAAEARRGALINAPSKGSVNNLERLAAGNCDEPGFALVQDGFDFRQHPQVRLVARLPIAETVFFLGRTASELTRFAQLHGKRVGIGPAGSGSSRMAHELLARLPGLTVQVFELPLAEQLEQLERGALDVGVFVMSEDAALIRSAVVERGLQIAGFDEVPGVAQRLPSAQAGVLPVGRLDPVRRRPELDKPVLRLDTLMVANACPSRSDVMGVMSLLHQTYPHLVELNRQKPGPAGLPVHSHARAYLDNNGPELLDEYVPWLANLIPLGNLVQLVMAVSILFNIMGAGHRFRLWRIDAGRVHLEGQLPDIFGPEVVIQEIAKLEPTAEHREAAKKERLEVLIRQLDELKDRVRRYSLSMLVPMGQEMAYRYQETLVAERIAVLRDFRRRLG